MPYEPRNEAVPVIAANITSGRWFGHPLTAESGRILSDFLDWESWRKRLRMGPHAGIDLDDDQEPNQQLVAVADGIVTLITNDPTVGSGPGTKVRIEHPYGLMTEYMHLVHDSWSGLIEKDQRVQRGDPIGQVGKTGNTTVTHAHLQVFDQLRVPTENTMWTTDDPKEFLSTEPIAVSFREVVRVASGQTLSDLATEHGVEPDVLAHFNGLREPTVIRLGQRIFVPTAEAERDLRRVIGLTPTDGGTDEPVRRDIVDALERADQALAELASALADVHAAMGAN